MSIPTQITPDTVLTSHQVGRILQVNPSSVNKWVADGRIPAFRTPGGHRRIRAGDLVVFLTTHSMPVPERLALAARRRLMVVDDDPRLLSGLGRLFRPYADSIELITVDNGIDALVLVGARRPHMVVLDFFMPGLDGVEVCRRLRAMPETADLMVVISSGQMTPEIAQRGREAGAQLCINKPVNVSQLVSMLGVRVQESVGLQPA